MAYVYKNIELLNTDLRYQRLGQGKCLGGLGKRTRRTVPVVCPSEGKVSQKNRPRGLYGLGKSEPEEPSPWFKKNRPPGLVPVVC